MLHALAGFVQRASPAPRVLIALGVLSALLWAFGAIVDQVMEGDTGRFDQATLLLFRNPADLPDAIGPPWLEIALTDITVLGNPSILTLVTVIATAFLALAGRYISAALVALAISSGAIAEQFMKAGFDRARPDLVPHLVEVSSLSFPSGHAMLSAVTYLTIGALAAQNQQHRRTGIFVLAAAILLTLLISFSRVYLGVHWPTDVMAGWAIGSFWALAFWLLAEWLAARRARQRNG